MNNEAKKIERSLNRLHDLQASQLESFGKDILPDLEKQSAQRNIEVDDLTRRVIKFEKQLKNNGAVITESFMPDFNDRIAALLEQNRALETKVRTMRDSIKQGMTTVSKGKKAIGSYRSSARVSNNPKVISITN